MALPSGTKSSHSEPLLEAKAGLRGEKQVSFEETQGQTSKDGEALSEFDQSKHALMIRYGAYLFVWIIGFVALVKLLTDFSSCLKPLVLALLVASILEWSVQKWEKIFWKFGVFLSLLTRLVAVMVWICMLYVYWAFHKAFSYCRKPERRTPCSAREWIRKWIEGLCDWTPMKQNWHGSYAGQNSALRFCAVLMTLLLVALGLMGLYSMIMLQVEDMLKELDGYKQTVTQDIKWIMQHLHELADMVPHVMHKPVKNTIDKLENMEISDHFVNKIYAYANVFLQDVVAQTESLAMGLCFFFLYTFLWLFVPMHVNSHSEKAKQFKTLHLRQYTKTPSYVEGEDHHQHELQEHLYKVVWEYFISMSLIIGVFALAVQLLLWWFKVSLSTFVALSCFFLGFIPELGTIIAIVLPLPLVIFAPRDHNDAPSDHNKTSEQTDGAGTNFNPFANFSTVGWMTLWVFVGMVLIKLLVANVLTSLIMGRNRTLAGAVSSPPSRRDVSTTGFFEFSYCWSWCDVSTGIYKLFGSNKEEVGESGDEMDVKETHPVVILFVVVLSGQIWGPVGMLISVPVVSLCRLAVNVWYMEDKNQK